MYYHAIKKYKYSDKINLMMSRMSSTLGKIVIDHSLSADLIDM